MPKRPRLQVQDFGIGWICAIQVEVDAARIVLDEEYEDIHEAATYILGRIGRHNVVIACPPAGEIGIGAAAATAGRLLSLFTSVRYWLMVGIGGGVPSSADIRLGDVVISQPFGAYGGVVQYDKGKTGPSGQWIRTGSLNAPPQDLLTAVTKLRSNVNIGRTGIWDCINTITSAGLFARPASDSDVLFEASYEHVRGFTCRECALERAVARKPRTGHEVVLHYGLIASGNQVIKDGLTRDTLSQEFGGILCFEMEAAGLMNNIPCLVIRGICDYADSHKNKRWQPFAAATAAATAKEILNCVSASALVNVYDQDFPEISLFTHSRTSTRTLKEDASHGGSPKMDDDPRFLADQLTMAKPVMTEDEQQRLFESLRFDQLDSRYSSIKTAHSKTCRWLLTRPEFKGWLDVKLLKMHHGFLWIKGKAATGKSTIMKFLLSHIRKLECAAITAAFFFNARGMAIEKSAIGMYQSILYQIFEQSPSTRSVFKIRKPALDTSGSLIWDVEALQLLIRAAIKALGHSSITLLIDALDECDDDEVQDMVNFFEDVCGTAVASDSQVRILFSSRHYPHISVEKGTILILEDQSEHVDDIAEYLRTELKAGESRTVQNIRKEILDRASGIFLWVVLVVEMLNKEYRRGRIHALEKRLKELPNDIEKLFEDILRRGGECPVETILCIQWVLYADRSLRLEELYFAVLAASDPSSLVCWDKSEITREDMERFLLDASKGLLEQTKGKNKTFQFIHESVREFFLTGKGLNGPPFAPSDSFSARSHNALSSGCWSYCNWAYPELSQLMKHSGFDIHSPHPSTSYYRQCHSDWMTYVPFLEYAAQNMLAHCEAAACLGLDQSEFLTVWNFSKWVCLSNIFQKSEKNHREYRTSVLYALADEDLLHPMRAILVRGGEFEKLEPRHQRLVLAGLVEGDPPNLETIKEWLRVDTSSSTTQGAITSHEERGTHKDTSLTFPRGLRLSDEAVSQAMMYLRKHRRHISERARDTTLLWGSRHGHLGLVQVSLADPECVVSAKNHKKQGAYELAVLNGHAEVIRILLERVVPPEDDYREFMHAAVSSGHLDLLSIFPSGLITMTISQYPMLVKELSDLTRQVNTRVEWKALAIWLLKQNLPQEGLDRKLKFDVFMSSAQNGDLEIFKLLLDQNNFDVNVLDEDGESPLTLAAYAGQIEIVQLLLGRAEIQADILTADGYTPLLLATLRGHVKVVKALLRHDNIGLNHRSYGHRDITVAIDGGTALWHAVRFHDAEIVEALLAHDHIDVNAGIALLQAVEIAQPTDFTGERRVLKMLLDHKDIDDGQKACLARTRRRFSWDLEDW